MIKVAVFDTKPYDKKYLSEFAEKESISLSFFETKLDENTVSLAQNHDAVCVFVNDNVNDAVINALKQRGIKMIALRCAGFNNVDLNAAFGNIHVLRVPSYSPNAVAEHAMALLLTSIRRIHKAYNRTRDFNFSLNGLTGFDLNGKTCGVIGTGKIGKVFINICKGFGMNILAYDPYPDAGLDVEYVDKKTLFEKSDIISLHCPLTEDTDHIIDSDSISLMKKGVVIINTSRGALIDTESLIEGIKERKVGAACLDVYEEESDLFFEDRSGHIMNDENLARLISMPNVLITSHQAFLTEEALRNIAETTINNIKRFFNDEKTENEICYHCSRTGECRKKRSEKCF